MQVGDLVRLRRGTEIGIVTCIDPEQVGDDDEIEVHWNDGDVCIMSSWNVEVINESG